MYRRVGPLFSALPNNNLIIEYNGMHPIKTSNPGRCWQFIVAALISFLTTILLAGAALANDAQSSGGKTIRANILYLNSYHDGYGWSDEILEGLRTRLNAYPEVELQVEYMDLKRYPRAHITPLLVDLYKHKFQDRKFDLVVVSDNPAFEFWQKYGDQLYPGLPVVFCGVNDIKPTDIEGRNMTGVVENFDVEATLNVALSLHPRKTRLVIIGDTSITGRHIMNQVMSVKDRFAGRLEFIPCPLSSLKELDTLVDNASDNTIFYFIPFYTQLEGRFYSATEILEIVHRRTSAPIYTNWEFLLGHGAMGGKMLSGRVHGQLAADYALKILAGAEADRLPVREHINAPFEFDYKVLMEQGISLGSLPENSKIINNPKTFYRLNKRLFWTFIVSIATLLMFTGLLVRNIMQRRAVERRMYNQLSFQELLLDTIPQLICWKDRENNILGANRYYLRFFGANDVSGLEKLEGQAKKDYEAYAKWANRLNNKVVQSEKTMPGIKRSVANATGGVRQLEVKKVPLRDKVSRVVGTLTMSEDVTKAVNLEKQLQQSQKMEAIGNLSGGIAHDFNNILTSIINSVELALMDVDSDTPAGKDLKRALRAAQRGSALVKQILTFTRPSKEGMVPIRIQNVVHEALSLLNASLPRNICVQGCISERLPMCVADPNQINQIVMNLCTNAFHSLRDTGGTIEINLGEALVQEEQAELKGLSPGKYVELVVTDDGPGIASDIMDKIFDPFFTTKGVTEGTGLGLSVVMGIVRGHQGALIPEHTGIYEIMDEKTDDLPYGSGHLLFVEDDDDQYHTIPRVLESIGYTVTATQDPVAALSIVDGDPKQFDLVITDFDMPIMDGIALARTLGEKIPGVPVIVVTGRKTALEKAGPLDNIDRIVLKPYDRKTIAIAIKEVLTRDD
jgi:two-component system cell cycle sensor histidine kinase/response regulator CckA